MSEKLNTGRQKLEEIKEKCLPVETLCRKLCSSDLQLLLDKCNPASH